MAQRDYDDDTGLAATGRCLAVAETEIAFAKTPKLQGNWMTGP